jgi:PAS domain S-box-containing protein
MKKNSKALSKPVPLQKKKEKTPIAKRALKKTQHTAKGKKSSASSKQADGKLKKALQDVETLKARLKQKNKELKTAQKDFLANHTKYNAIVDNSLSALFLGKPDGTILEVNPAACDMFGYTPAEFLKIDRSGFIDSTSPDALKKIRERSKKKKVRGEMTGIRKNGEHFPCEVVSVLFKNSEGEERSSTTIIDITERKKQEHAVLEANLHMQMILDNTEESFFVIDRELKIVTFNKTAQRMVTQLLGKSFKKGDQILSLGHPERVKELRKMYDYILAGNTYQYKYSVLNKKKEAVVFSLHFTPVKVNKRVLAIMVNARDITKEENALQEITKQQQQLKEAENIAKIGSWEWNVVSGKLRWSDEFFRICGFEPQSFEPSYDIFVDNIAHPEDKQEMEQLIERSIKTGEQYSQIFRIVAKDKTIKFIENKGQVLADKTGKSIKLIGVSRDITQELEQEKELLQSEERYRQLFYNNPMPMWVYDSETLAFLEVNTAAILHYGYSKEEFLAMTIADIRPIEDIARLQQIEHVTFNEFKRHSGHWQHLRKNGTVIQVEVTAHSIIYNGEKANLVLAHDITDRIKAEREKEFNTRNTQALINSTNDLIWSIDTQKRLIVGNTPFLKFIEIHTGTILSPGAALIDEDYFDAPQREYWDKLYDRVLSGESFSVINFLDTDNGKIWSETYFDPIMENDRVLGAAMYTKNITDRKKLEDQKGLFVSIVNYSEDAIISKTLDGTIISWNEGAKKLFGYTANEMIGKNISLLIPPHLANDEKEIIYKISQGSYIQQFETHRMKKDGSLVDISLTVSPIADAEGRIIGASKIARDISERKRAEEQMNILNLELKKRAEELSNSNSELEQFAYVASHDLQEPLRMVSSFLQLLQKQYEGKLDETGTKYIHYAVDGADRMKRLILDLLQYSRAGTASLEIASIDVNQLVDEVLVLYKDADAEFDIGPLPVVQGAKTAMMQLFQNLIGNAIKYKSSRKTQVKVYSEENEQEWKFTIEDNGIGIDPKFYDKIFIVFQRLHTKEQFSGTGVGLAICKKIVERYRGRIWVESEPGKGSKFVFTLPKKIN